MIITSVCDADHNMRPALLEKAESVHYDLQGTLSTLWLWDFSGVRSAIVETPARIFHSSTVENRSQSRVALEM